MGETEFTGSNKGIRLKMNSLTKVSFLTKEQGNWSGVEHHNTSGVTRFHSPIKEKEGGGHLPSKTMSKQVSDIYLRCRHQSVVSSNEDTDIMTYWKFGGKKAAGHERQD